MRHLGNVTVTHENYPSFPPADEIFGHVMIQQAPTDVFDSFRVDTGRLTLIRGWLTLQPGAQVIAPRLGRVDGWLDLKGNNVFISSALQQVSQDLIVGTGSRDVMLPNLKTVHMSIALWQNVVLELPELLSVGNIALRAGSKLIAPKLTTVNGSITMDRNTELNAPELTHIAKYLDADPLATIVAPKFGAA